jgi:uncharacterized protein
MITRAWWQRRVEQAWRSRSIVWLMGVRRAGKTVLAQTMPGVIYLDCELPSTRRLLNDPEGFLTSHRGRRLVLDEVHRVADPAALLKVAADHFPDIRILATGSSTLGASSRFRDTLAGRKAEVWLTPMTCADLESFGAPDLRHRLHRGGLPPFFLSETLPEADFQEWVDAYWAKDILELFRLERRHAFGRLLELIMAQSGGIFEASPLARSCEISRTTVANYVAVLEATFVVHLVRPYVGGGAAEMVAAPRAYAFDTGFVCFFRGWQTLRPDDLGILWEHFVLNELHAHLGRRPVHYWRTKHGMEVDFVIARRGAAPALVECKWSADEFDPAGMRAFRARYPGQANYVIASDVRRSFDKRYRELAVRFVPLGELPQALARPGS